VCVSLLNVTALAARPRYRAHRSPLLRIRASAWLPTLVPHLLRALLLLLVLVLHARARESEQAPRFDCDSSATAHARRSDALRSLSSPLDNQPFSAVQARVLVEGLLRSAVSGVNAAIQATQSGAAHDNSATSEFSGIIVA
jgi:hypothetical protein